MTDPTASTVASADIARLAGVGRAAVSNWRRRFPDFPEPVGGTASSPLYRLADVERWLAAHGRSAEITPMDRIWQGLRSTVDDHRLGEVVGDLAGLLSLLTVAKAEWPRVILGDGEGLAVAVDRALAGAGVDFPAAAPGVGDEQLFRSVAALAAQLGPAAVLTRLVDRLQEATARRLQTTPAAICRIAAELAEVRGRTVLDPACGTGGLLDAAREAGAAALRGADVDSAAARISAGRVVTAKAHGSVARADSLRRDPYRGERFGAVLCEPPFGERDWGYEELVADPRWELGSPPRGEPELAWLQHCLAHAEPGAPVVLVLPAATASRRAGRRIRGNLVRSGALRMIASIPDDSGRPLDLWFLIRDAEPAEVLFLTVGVDEIAARWRAFAADPQAADGPGSQAVRPLDLLDDDVDLSPTRHVPATAGEMDLGALAAEVTAARAGLPDLPALVAQVREVASTTVGDLAKAGAVEILQAPLRTSDEGPRPMLTVRDLTARRGPTGHTEDTDGMVVLAAGDVVLPAVAGRENAARVVEGALVGAVLGPRLLCLRPDRSRVDPHLLAGCVGVPGARPRTASGMSRTDARKLTLPLLPVGEQRTLGAAFAQLAALDDAVRRLSAASEQYVGAAVSALAAGRAGVP
ncbi:N-6 DNA methylase [Pseudonocardia lutea]|uniref:N-6 DNA methylase n=1 Tax=Pseudonocardia lutea TaxID=2172015 RepID=A0ABW1I005_9PSEU